MSQPKIAILTCHSSGNADLAKLTAQNKWDYSAKHGYDLVTLRMEWEDSKVGFLRVLLDFLPKYDAILTVGSDVIFMNTSRKIENIVEQGDSIILAKEKLGDSNTGWSTINNDVVLWRNTARTRFLIQRLIISRSEWLALDHLWQRWLDNQLKHSRPDWIGTIRLVEPRVMNAAALPGINNESGWQPGDWIIHLVCFTPEHKIRLAKMYLPVVDQTWPREDPRWPKLQTSTVLPD